MKDRVKKALKRAASGLMAVLLAVCLVGTPRAKAVVSEGALLGSIFGSLLVSMGFSWAAENMDVPTFGESIYKLIQEHDEANKDTGVQLIRDLSLAGIMSVGAGKLQFSQSWVNAARSFAEWFQGKFFTGDNTSAVVEVSNGLSYYYDCDYFTIDFPDFIYFKQSWNSDYYLSVSMPLTVAGNYSLTTVYGWTSDFQKVPGTYYIPNNNVSFSVGGKSRTFTITHDSERQYYNFSVSEADLEQGATLSFRLWWVSSQDWYHPVSGDKFVADRRFGLSLQGAPSLAVEKPAEVHYPDVAEDGSQVYEVTYQGVTATDIEGIIQGAVDRIIAGTAAIVGSVEQAGTAEEVTNPEIEPYKVALTSVFPFCIPFDVYNMVTMFVAEPEAPHAEWTFTLPWSGQEYSVGWDLSDFDGVAQVCRNMELVLFAVGLAVITYKVIKW